MVDLSKTGINVSAAVEKMAELNNQKAATLHKTMEHLQSKYGGGSHDDESNHNVLPNLTKSQPKVKSKMISPRQQSNEDNDIATKFERLTKF
jgi:hypothetical protein